MAVITDVEDFFTRGRRIETFRPRILAGKGAQER